MRHPGLQHQNRLREMADAIAAKQGEWVQMCWDVRGLEEKLEKAQFARAQAKMELVPLTQVWAALTECDGYTDWGLPGNMDKEHYEAVLGKKIS